MARFNYTSPFAATHLKLYKEYHTLLDNYQELELQEEELVSCIEDIQLDIEELNAQIKDCERQIKNDLDEISSKEKELEMTRQQLQIKEELDRLSEQVDKQYHEVRNDVLEHFRQYAKTFNPYTAFAKELYPDTKTVALLDEYDDSMSDFLVLKNQFYLNHNDGFASLIICRYEPMVDADETSPTMTELKKYKGRCVKFHSYMPKRLNPLVDALESIDETNYKMNEKEVFVFDRPFLIGGQTSEDRTGYGCEWTGGGDYILGTLYGEVTKFMAVGFMFTDNEW